MPGGAAVEGVWLGFEGVGAADGGLISPQHRSTRRHCRSSGHPAVGMGHVSPLSMAYQLVSKYFH